MTEKDFTIFRLLPGDDQNDHHDSAAIVRLSHFDEEITGDQIEERIKPLLQEGKRVILDLCRRCSLTKDEVETIGKIWQQCYRDNKEQLLICGIRATIGDVVIKVNKQINSVGIDVKYVNTHEASERIGYDKRDTFG